MPNNSTVNKVILGDETLIDLTADTATANDVALGKLFHAANGVLQTGALEVPEAGLVYETGHFTLYSNLKTKKTINFTKTHSQPPVVVFGNITTSESSTKSTTIASTWYRYRNFTHASNGYYYKNTITNITSGNKLVFVSTNSDVPTTTNFNIVPYSAADPLNQGTWEWLAIWAPNES